MWRIIFFIIFFPVIILSQNQAWDIAAGYQFGKIVPNYRQYPATGWRQGLLINLYKKNTDIDQDWKIYFRHPETGIQFSISHLGNQQVFGKEICLVPYLVLHTSSDYRRSFDFVFGLGAAYQTKYYHRINNPKNEALGSALNWAFTLGLNKQFFQNKKIALQFGLSYLHASNAHVQLPNYGLNSGAASLFCRRPIKKNLDSKVDEYSSYSSNPRRTYYIQWTSGIGIHELGSTDKPIGGLKKLIYSNAVTTAIAWRSSFKLRAGFTHRYYQAYHDIIDDKPISELLPQQNKYAQHVHFLLGFEFMFNHFSADIEGGLGLYRPFFKTFSVMYEKYPGFKYWLKNLFPAHLGLQYYLIRPQLLPKHNVFIGANINANFGQADFSEFVLGYCHKLK